MTAAQDDPARLVVAFVDVLRRRGVAVPPDRSAMFASALAAIDLRDRAQVYWAGRAALAPGPEQLAAYDTAFAQFWEGSPPPRTVEARQLSVVVELPEADVPDGPDIRDGDSTTVVRYSPVEVLRHRDFAAYTPADFAAARRLMDVMRVHAAVRPSRRLRRATRGPHVDVRRTVHRARRAGGEIVRLDWKGPRSQPRRLVLLCDVSGSMEPYARALLGFAHAARSGRTRVEVFTLGTRLTRLTRTLASRDPDSALAAAAAAVPDWSGGTRLGDGLRAFNDEWGVRGMARGAVVVVMSDGWDRGDPAVLGEQMARLHRVAYRIVWVNPLKAAPGYAPLARGMAAALPWVDAFVEGHSLAALEHLAAVIGAPPR